MRSILLLAAAVAGTFGFVSPASAQVPVAVVEDIKGKPAGVEFMDYVAAGKVIKLGPKDTIVLGYMKSCWRETITGGIVIVGAEESMIHLGKIERSKVNCDAGRMQLTKQEASQSAATVIRSVKPITQVTIYGLSPIIEIKGSGTLVIERLDKEGERHALKVGDKSLVRGKFYDLAKARKALTPGGLYRARFGTMETVFKVDPQAKPGSTPIIGRLLRLQQAG